MYYDEDVCFPITEKKKKEIKTSIEKENWNVTHCIFSGEVSHFSASSLLGRGLSESLLFDLKNIYSLLMLASLLISNKTRVVFNPFRFFF